MKAIQDAVRLHLQKATGVRTVADRTRVTGEYRLLAVVGGRQAEHTYRVTVTAAADRNREENTALLASLVSFLLRGVPVEDRTLHPLDVKTESGELTFSLELCVPVPPGESTGEEAIETMGMLHLGV